MPGHADFLVEQRGFRTSDLLGCKHPHALRRNRGPRFGFQVGAWIRLKPALLPRPYAPQAP